MLWLRWLILKCIAWPLGMAGFIPPWPIAKLIGSAFAQFPGGQITYSYVKPGPCPCPQCRAARGEYPTEPIYGACGQTLPPSPRC